ncbi:holin [Cronobacter sakazakii]|nr:HP1 family phage holin [Cronobacter sakazakii]PPX83824.1 holin [Cronobacter sakazakii]
MGMNIERITSIIAYWLSVVLAMFGAATPQDFAAWFGVLGVCITVVVNWYYRRKGFALLEMQARQSGITGEDVNNAIR